MKLKKRIIAVALAMWVCAALAASAAYVILTDGRRIEGTDIRVTADGSVVLTTARGPITFARGQYTQAMADKPAEWDRVQQLVQARQYDQAIPILNDLARRYSRLGWDIQALSLLARVQMAKGDAAAAVATYDNLIRANPAVRENSELMWGFRQALLAAKQFDRLATDLSEVISKGSRTDAARAQIMRGDIKMAQNQVEGAVLDYLRTVIFFESERTVLPEALLKAAKGLEQLRDPRAKEMYRRVAQEFPNSPQAAEARAKI